MAISRFIFHKISKTLSSRSLYIIRSLSYRRRPQALPPSVDYVRYATLGLCYEEITSNGVKGNVAELGVYKGEFSRRLNLLFAQRKLYLFDTFEGFSENDVAVEHQKGYSTANQDFSQTSIELVRSKMTYPENCIFKPGYFPQSARGIDDSFCFVSIDADLYEPIYNGLIFFYPRLEKGGYIFIHDFNNEKYPGTREAVLQYCKENDVRYVPVPDSGGTVIIAK